MRKSAGQIIGWWTGTGVSMVLAGVGLIALRHALETPQAQKSVLPGEAHLYRWQRRSIFYKVLGETNAPPLVLLHRPAIGASSHEMLPLMAPLARMYRVYALDWLGFGLSDRPGIAYSAELYNRLCEDFLREVVQAPATVVASGLSCNYAVVAAANAPAFCESLVLISPCALQGGQSSPRLGQTVEATPVKALLYPLLSTRLAFQVTRQIQEETRDDFAQFYANTHQLGAEHATMAWLAGKLTRNVEQSFEILRQPILMIWGTHALDSSQTVASLHKTVTLANPARQTRKVELIQQAALAVHTEQPDSVIAAIKRWQEETTKDQPPVLDDELLLTLRTIEQSAAPEEALNVPEQSVLPRSEEFRQPDKPSSAIPPTGYKAKDMASNAPSETTAVSASSPSEIDKEEAKQAVAKDGQDKELAVTAYCVKCKQKRQILHAQEVTMKNGRRAIRGICPVCGIRLNRMGRSG